MKKRYLAFFVFLIGIFLVCGTIAEKDIDYKDIIRKASQPIEVSAILNIDKQLEDSEDDTEDIKEQLRELGYLD